MTFFKKILYLSFAAALTASPIKATTAPDSNFHCYLLFGQSNMAGGGAGVTLGGSGSGTLIAADCDTSPRVKRLAFCNCNAGSGTACTQYPQSHTKDTWYTAYPPIHICDEGLSPGDWFAKTMLDSIRSDIKIGLIPCALSGQALNVFVKGGSNFNIPTWAHPTLGNSSPYAWMLARCKLAQQTGVIKGFLLHQGESGSGGESWVTMATKIFDTLKKDLGLDNTLPVVVGELRQDNYASFNTQQVDKLASQYPNCGLASSAGLGVQSDDTWHFNAAGMREFGKRYAQALLLHASATFIPRKGSVSVESVKNDRALLYRAMKSATSGICVYSLNGRAVRSYSTANAGNALRDLNTGGVYILYRKLNDGRTAFVPFIKE
jgi:hypothetical protein